MDIKPITREEMYLAKAAGQDVSLPEPITRKEMFLAKIAGMEVETPGTITRLEMFANEVAVALNRSVIEPLEITENGTYTPPEGVAGYNPVTVNVDPTKITILREQQFDGFVLDESFGAYSPGFVSPAEFVLNSGETYHVIWDGTSYECTAVSFEYYDMSMVAIGDGSYLGLPGNGEPFLITYNIPGNGIQLFSNEDAGSHTVGIWQKISITSDDVRYVTFKSYDGSVEYGKKAVAVGDDCADPIARGIFDKPTRESDVQYNYTFYGWANEPNGGADANWNKAITEDKTVYANFTSTVRYYTITYYDDDGTTVLKTESLPYGAIPSYTPIKENITFDRWKPAVSAVTKNSNYTAVWIEKISFANASYEKISEIIAAGKAKDHFSIGDTKDVGPYTVVIVGFDHDTLADGSGTAAISLALNEVCSETWEATNLTIKGKTWASSSLRTQIAGLIDDLPEELRAMIKPVRKYHTTTSSTSISYCTDSLWALSRKEIGDTTASAYNEGTAYPYYTSNEQRILKYGSSAEDYWLRSNASWNGSWGYVSTAGKCASVSSGSRNLHFGFCI